MTFRERIANWISNGEIYHLRKIINIQKATIKELEGSISDAKAGEFFCKNPPKKG